MNRELSPAELIYEKVNRNITSAQSLTDTHGIVSGHAIADAPNQTPLELTQEWIWETVSSDGYVRRAALSDFRFLKILGELCFATRHEQIGEAETKMEAAVERFALIQLAAFREKRNAEAIERRQQ